MIQVKAFILENKNEQLVKMPDKSSILDIQIHNGQAIMWTIGNDHFPAVDVKINRYTTGQHIDEKRANDHYLGTVRHKQDEHHYFMET